MSIKSKLLILLLIIGVITGSMAGYAIYSSLANRSLLHETKLTFAELYALIDYRSFLNDEVHDVINVVILERPILISEDYLHHKNTKYTQLYDKLLESSTKTLNFSGITDSDYLDDIKEMNDFSLNTLYLLNSFYKLKNDGDIEEAKMAIYLNHDKIINSELNDNIDIIFNNRILKIENNFEALLLHMGIYPFFSEKVQKEVQMAENSIERFIAIEQASFNIKQLLTAFTIYYAFPAHDHAENIKMLSIKARISLEKWIIAMQLHMQLIRDELGVNVETKQWEDMRNIISTYNQIVSLLDNATVLLSNGKKAEAYVLIEGEILPLTKKYNSFISSIVGGEKEKVADAHATLLKFTNNIERQGIIILIVMPALLIFISFRAVRSMLSSLSSIQNGIAIISSGSLNHKIVVKAKDEFFILASMFNNMAEEIKKKQDEILFEKDYIDNIVNSINDMLIVISLDGKIKTANKATCNLLEYQEKDIINLSAENILSEGLLDQGTIFSFDFIYNKCSKDSIEAVFKTKNGKKIHVSVSCSTLKNVNGNIDGLICTAKDITRMKLAEDALRQSEEKYSLAMRSTNDGLWEWDIKKDEFYFSPRWKHLLGFEENEIGTKPSEWFSRIHEDDGERVKRDLEKHLEGTTSHFENEHRMAHRDGSYIWLLCRGLAVWEGDEIPVRVMGSISDITRRKLVEKKLQYDNSHDRLTELPNRAAFIDLVNRALEYGRQHKTYIFFILYVNLSKINKINEYLGYKLGDKLIIDASERLKTAVRPGDTVSRLTGNEFGVLLDNLKSIKNLPKVVERVHNKLKQPFSINGEEIYITPDIGIAQNNMEYCTGEDLLRNAHTAMNKAKNAGSGKYEIFNPQMQTNTAESMKLEADLRRAVERNEFQLYYQPIVDMKTGCVSAAEALLRWKHPVRGFVSPMDFIPIAEDTGLILPLGEWIFKTACKQAKILQISGFPKLRMKINVSVKQFQQPDIVKIFSKTIREINIDAGLVEVEITETVAMDNIQMSLEILKEIASIGFKISIDDFGTGYSSLGYLKKFPINTLKIDKSFVNDIPKDADANAIANAIIAFARSLKLTVVAEGVETADQLDFLRANGCDEMQGYYFSRPLPATEFTELLISGKKLNFDPFSFENGSKKLFNESVNG